MHRLATRHRVVIFACAASLAAVGLVASLGMGQQPGQPADGPAPGGPEQMGQALIQGLKETRGCLGVDSARFSSGKNTIVAWFENKAAAERWYNHPVHTRMLRAVGADPADRTPLEHVTDPNIPIMVMASISFDGEPAIPGSPIPFSQISIELYTPLPGGASVNGRLAPEGFKVEHHRSLDAG